MRYAPLMLLALLANASLAGQSPDLAFELYACGDVTADRSCRVRLSVRNMPLGTLNATVWLRLPDGLRVSSADAPLGQFVRQRGHAGLVRLDIRGKPQLRATDLACLRICLDRAAPCPSGGQRIACWGSLQLKDRVRVDVRSGPHWIWAEHDQDVPDSRPAPRDSGIIGFEREDAGVRIWLDSDRAEVGEIHFRAHGAVHLERIGSSLNELTLVRVSSGRYVLQVRNCDFDAVETELGIIPGDLARITGHGFELVRCDFLDGSFQRLSLRPAGL